MELLVPRSRGVISLAIFIDSREVEEGTVGGEEALIPEEFIHFAARRELGERREARVYVVLSVHEFPEGVTALRVVLRRALRISRRGCLTIIVVIGSISAGHTISIHRAVVEIIRVETILVFTGLLRPDCVRMRHDAPAALSSMTLYAAHYFYVLDCLSSTCIVSSEVAVHTGRALSNCAIKSCSPAVIVLPVARVPFRAISSQRAFSPQMLIGTYFYS